MPLVINIEIGNIDKLDEVIGKLIDYRNVRTEVPLQMRITKYRR